MYLYKSTIIALSITFMLISVLPASAQQGEKRKNDCPPGVLTTTFTAPPAGMANYRIVWLDEQCNLVEGPVLTVAIDRLPAIALDQQMRSTVLSGISVGPTPQGFFYLTTYHAEQAVLDLVNITLNKLYSDITYTYDGTQILSYRTESIAFSHRENMPPSCGPGWNLANSFQAQTSGGVGMNHAGFVQQGEFAYRGIFDCSGNIYYNRLANYTTVHANGTGTCQFTQHYRTWSAFWYWTTTCY